MTKPRWIDPRLLIGVALVAASIVGVWLVVDSATKRTTVWAASETLVPGDVIEASDLVETQLDFSGDGLYLSAADDPVGMTVVSTIGAGEAVPVSAIGSADSVDLAPLVISIDGGLPSTLDAGSVVDVWSAAPGEETEFAPPTVLVGGATVVGVVEQEGLITGNDVQVEVLVPRSEAGSVLDAAANAHELSLVPTSIAVAAP